ncbi:MAG: hypothetical protein F4080_13050 [Holophagales bacterium]|nr:hypothetical protein [Holophagales bacterium]
MLDEAGLLDRLYHAARILRVPESEVLAAMDKAMQADEDLDYEYALYDFVFKKRKVKASHGYHLLQYDDDGTQVSMLVARKGAFAPNPADSDPRYQHLPFPNIEVTAGRPFEHYLPLPYIPATKKNRLFTVSLRGGEVVAR